MKELTPDFNGTIPVENRFHFTNLKKCTFRFKLVNFYKPADWVPGYQKGDDLSVNSPDLRPGAKGELKLALPSNWKNYDALILTAVDPFENEIYSWTWQIRGNNEILKDFVTLSGETKAEVTDADSTITLNANGTSVTLHKRSGTIVRVIYNNRSSDPFRQWSVF